MPNFSLKSLIRNSHDCLRGAYIDTQAVDLKTWRLSDLLPDLLPHVSIV